MKGVLAVTLTVFALLATLTALVDAVLPGDQTSSGASTGGEVAGGPDAPAGPVSSAGWTRPAPGGVGSGFRTAARPGHDGVDLLAPRGAVIRAASAGVVVTVLCNAHLGDSPYPCDRDGSPAVKGCGWYVEVRHPGDVVTRYCHMGTRPLVTVGQPVTAGQPLGRVGSSGNSSGPHLHYEVHDGYPTTSGNAEDPVPFMTAHGIRL